MIYVEGEVSEFDINVVELLLCLPFHLLEQLSTFADHLENPTKTISMIRNSKRVNCFKLPGRVFLTANLFDYKPKHSTRTHLIFDRSLIHPASRKLAERRS